MEQCIITFGNKINKEPEHRRRKKFTPLPPCSYPSFLVLNQRFLSYIVETTQHWSLLTLKYIKQSYYMILYTIFATDLLLL